MRRGFSTRRSRRSRRHQTSGASDLCGLGDLCVGTTEQRPWRPSRPPGSGFTQPPRAAEHLFEMSARGTPDTQPAPRCNDIRERSAPVPLRNLCALRSSAIHSSLLFSLSSLDGSAKPFLSGLIETNGDAKMFFQHGEHGDHGDTRRAVHPISVASVISVLEPTEPRPRLASRPPDPISRTRRGQPSISSRCPLEELPILGGPPLQRHPREIRTCASAQPLRTPLLCDSLFSSLLLSSLDGSAKPFLSGLIETNGHAKMILQHGEHGDHGDTRRAVHPISVASVISVLEPTEPRPRLASRPPDPISRTRRGQPSISSRCPLEELPILGGPPLQRHPREIRTCASAQPLRTPLLCDSLFSSLLLSSLDGSAKPFLSGLIETNGDAKMFFQHGEHGDHGDTRRAVHPISVASVISVLEPTEPRPRLASRPPDPISRTRRGQPSISSRCPLEELPILGGPPLQRHPREIRTCASAQPLRTPLLCDSLFSSLLLSSLDGSAKPFLSGLIETNGDAKMFFQHGEHGDHGDTRRAVHPISVASVISVLEPTEPRPRLASRPPRSDLTHTGEGSRASLRDVRSRNSQYSAGLPCNDIRERSAPVPLRNLCALRSSAIHSSLLFFSSTAAPSHSSPRLAETNGHAKMFFSTRRARRSRRHQTSGASDLCGLGDLCVGTDRAQAAAGVTSPRTGFTYPPRAAEHLFEMSARGVPDTRPVPRCNDIRERSAPVPLRNLCALRASAIHSSLLFSSLPSTAAPSHSSPG